jgi:predicted nucleic acid-binding protein
MKVVDSSVWLEVAPDGAAAERCAPHLADLAEVVTPTLVMLEVYGVLRRNDCERSAVTVVGEMEFTRSVPADSLVALVAADLSLEYGLATADAIIFATARLQSCELVTADADFRGLPGVTLIEAGDADEVANPEPGA